MKFYTSDHVGMSPGSFRVVLFVKFIIDLTTSNEKYGQGHLPIFDPGLLYQASHKNTVELCKISIFLFTSCGHRRLIRPGGCPG